MKFAVMILYFDCEPFILKAIENCAPHVDKIYISYSKYPWLYNKNARRDYFNNVNKSLVFESAHVDKIDLIEGTWETEEEQRNNCLEKARSEGFDYLIIQDADEFYTFEGYQANLNQIIANPDALYYRVPWYLFWKSTNHIVLFDNVHGVRNTTVNYNPCFAVNLNKEVFFKKNRLLNTIEAMFLNETCYHLSYVMDDEQMLRKLMTWGHSHQVPDIMNWYRVKWLGWNEKTENIGIINPISWRKAVKFNGELPKEVLELRNFDNKFSKPKVVDYLKSFFIEVKISVYNFLSILKSILKN